MSSNPTPFQARCYELLKRVPAGQITTYKALGIALNSRAWRAVGSAMAQNPHPIVVPCHRVINSDGRLGGYAYGLEKKIELLRSEGIPIENQRVVNFEAFLFQFPDSETLSLSEKT